MAALTGRPPPILQGGEDGLTSEAGINKRQQLPRLVAPTPVHAAVPSFVQAGMDLTTPTPSHQAIEEEEAAAAAAGSSSTPGPASSLRARTDVDAILPIQGEAEDAQAAVDKLDRMQKALQSKRMWLRSTGAEGMAKVATAGGKKAYGKQIKKPTTKEEDAESIMSLPRYGEVKLGISSLPGYPIMAAQKAKRFLSKSHTQQDISRGKEQSALNGTGEESSTPWSSLPLRKPRAPQKLQRESSPAPVAKHVAADQETSTSPAPVMTNSNTAQHKPELTSVKENVRELPTPKLFETTSETTTLDPEPNKAVKRLQRPRLIIQSPSENGLPALTEGESVQHAHSICPSPKPVSTCSSSEEAGMCDDKAQAAAEACQDHIANPSLLSPGEVTYDSPTSSASSSSEDEDDDYSSDSEASLTPTTPQEELMLNLEHGEELTKKQKKRLLRKIRKSASGEDVEQDRRKLPVPRARRMAKRQGSLSTKMQSGLHYASSQSRNRRAMERYSPHPSRPNSAAPLAVPLHGRADSGNNLADMFASSRQTLPSSTGEGSRSSTPVLLSDLRGSALDSRRSSISEKEKPMGLTQLADGNFCLSPIVDDNFDREDRWGELAKSFRRQGTSPSINSSTTGNISFRKRYFSLRRKRQDTADLVEEGDSGTNTPKADPEKELDSMLRNLVAEQSPEQLEEQYEYDVLYENQRGLMFFGIPKFSAKTLFQWDPASWTNAHHENSAYNVVNAQLPNPYWEWVHPEWMIDMTGDVDESGWQYSYNFGQFTVPIFARPGTQIPRAGVKGNAVMNERMAKKTEKRDEKDNTRTDEGFEALKRTARSRNAKWTGIPDQNKYVRRRRWIRLRRRKALPHATIVTNTPRAGTPQAMGKASGDWTHLVQDEEKKREREQQRLTAKPAEQSSSSSSSSSDADSLSNLESDEADSDYTSQGAPSSAFLPRRTPGDLDTGGVDNRTAKEQEKLRRHAKEFTGTIRELKTLLPSILDRRHSIRPSNRQRLETELWMSEVDARNPFISWNLVKKRLDDDDLAFASASLRARERRYAQKLLERRGSVASAEAPSYDLTKDAVVEINYRRVMRVMRACKVDRHKVQLWKIWLGVEPATSITEVARDEDLANAGLAVGSTDNLGQEKRDAVRQARNRWRKSFSHPDVMDVWDLLERRLDRLLLTFEYQGSRASLLRLLLTLHATSHWQHRFQPTNTTVETDTNQTVDVNVPSSISPQAGSKHLWNLAAGQGSVQFPDEWRGVGLPRLEFWSDLEKCATTLLENGRNNASPSQDHPSQLNIGRGSPAPSIVRSSTPQMGSLASGPSVRRLTTPHPPSPLQIPRPTKASSTHRNDSVDRHSDQSFLAELLQLPAHSRQEMLVKTAEHTRSSLPQPHSSSVVGQLTRSVEEDEEEDLDQDQSMIVKDD